METTMDIEEYVNEDGDTVIEHITGLETLFEERSEDPCEHSEHGKRDRIHDGPGEWLILWHHCDKGSAYLLVCDRFLRAIKSDSLNIHCTSCDTHGLQPSEVYTILGRKGVDF